MLAGPPVNAKGRTAIESIAARFPEFLVDAIQGWL
jgi:hypothetical protein